MSFTNNDERSVTEKREEVDVATLAFLRSGKKIIKVGSVDDAIAIKNAVVINSRKTKPIKPK